MKSLEAWRIERDYHVRGIESESAGLYYFLDDDRKGVVIAGMQGKTGLSVSQAKALVRELPEILREMGFCL